MLRILMTPRKQRKEGRATEREHFNNPCYCLILLFSGLLSCRCSFVQTPTSVDSLLCFVKPQASTFFSSFDHSLYFIYVLFVHVHFANRSPSKSVMSMSLKSPFSTHGYLICEWWFSACIPLYIVFTVLEHGQCSCNVLRQELGFNHIFWEDHWMGARPFSSLL